VTLKQNIFQNKMIFELKNSLFWFLLGIALMVIELIMPGFVVIFFGIGALMTAIVSYFGVTDNIIYQIIIFLATSVITLVLFRKKWSSSFKGNVARKIQKGESIDNIIGQKALVTEEIVPGKLNGKVEFNGTLWEAQSEEHIKPGEVAEIISRKDLKLIVKKT